MTIKFEHTAQSGDKIEFVNDRGDIVKTYTLAELEQYVGDNELNIATRTDLVCGSGIVSDPNNMYSEIEVITGVSEWLDDQDNFVEACKMFYYENNPNEFKSANSEQQTWKGVR